MPASNALQIKHPTCGGATGTGATLPTSKTVILFPMLRDDDESEPEYDCPLCGRSFSCIRQAR